MAFGRWFHKLLGYPSVRAIQIASLHPGDLLVVQLPENATADLALHVRDLLKDRLPPTVNCCVMIDDGARFEVIRVVNPAERPLQRPIGG
jgi:hypothetical protein